MKRILVFLVLFLGCETVIDIDIPKEDPKLVLNGFFNPDSTFSVTLFESKYILDTGDFEPIGSALVSIFDNDGTKLTDLIDRGEGRYISTFIPESGREYRIEASRNGFESIFAEDMIPEDSARISNIELRNVTPPEELIYYEDGSGLYEITFTLQDFSGNDFYEVQIYEYSVFEYDGQVFANINHRYLDSEDPVFDDFSNSGIGLLFQDVLFDGNEKGITIETFLDLGNSCEEIPECKRQDFFFVTRKVSEAYFNYVRTFQLQQDLNGNPFAEPVSVFNNISNGYGVFAGFRESKFPLKAPDN